jgi:class 3 adenylate cyclase
VTGNSSPRSAATRRASFLQALDALAEQDARVADPRCEMPAGATPGPGAVNVVNPKAVRAQFQKWLEGDRPFPFESARKSRIFLWAYLTGLKALLGTSLGLSGRPPVRALSREEIAHSEGVVKWKGHLPPSTWRAVPDKLVSAASKCPTIAVVGDVRRSQDLMTYSDDPEDFSRRMVHFIATTRQLIERHHGFFDKFTGDGFLVYFNRTICRHCGADHADCFLSFVREELAFAREHFREWSRTIRKLPPGPVGLAVGADSGVIDFRNVDYHLIAVGEAIVWASRMASVASANEVVVNNLLVSALEGRPSLSLEPRVGRTKAGEEFLAGVLAIPAGPAAPGAT